MEKIERTVIQTFDLVEFERRSQQFLERLLQYFDGEKKKDVLNQLLGEIEANIKQHSQAELATFIFSELRGEFSLEDNGIGIGESFRNVGIKASDQLALERAISGTSTKGKERGRGLPSVVTLVNTLKGKLEIHSDKAGILIEGGQKFPLKAKERRGTKVMFNLPKSIDISNETFYNSL